MKWQRQQYSAYFKNKHGPFITKNTINYFDSMAKCYKSDISYPEQYRNVPLYVLKIIIAFSDFPRHQFEQLALCHFNLLDESLIAMPRYVLEASIAYIAAL